MASLRAGKGTALTSHCSRAPMALAHALDSDHTSMLSGANIAKFASDCCRGRVHCLATTRATDNVYMKSFGPPVLHAAPCDGSMSVSIRPVYGINRKPLTACARGMSARLWGKDAALLRYRAHPTFTEALEGKPASYLLDASRYELVRTLDEPVDDRSDACAKQASSLSLPLPPSFAAPQPSQDASFHQPRDDENRRPARPLPRTLLPASASMAKTAASGTPSAIIEPHGHRFKFWDLGAFAASPAPQVNTPPAQNNIPPLPPSPLPIIRVLPEHQAPSAPPAPAPATRSANVTAAGPAVARSRCSVHEVAPPARALSKHHTSAPCRGTRGSGRSPSSTAPQRLAQEQEAAARLAALTPLPPSPTLSQEARDQAFAQRRPRYFAPAVSQPTRRVTLVSWAHSTEASKTTVQDLPGWAQTWPTIRLADFAPFLTSCIHPRNLYHMLLRAPCYDTAVKGLESAISKLYINTVPVACQIAHENSDGLMADESVLPLRRTCVPPFPISPPQGSTLSAFPYCCATAVVCLLNGALHILGPMLLASY
ncbi:hypothetical protein B0H14DRAFT_3432620 [Mycena olivaceomarginata]|nr:hypothetical protein B0H14DRAFT_3432620 [Mycena olivaceomarginata]